jgi:hypothetical protein
VQLPDKGVVSLGEVLAYAADVFCVLTDVIGRVIGQPMLMLGSLLDDVGFRKDIIQRFEIAEKLCAEHGWEETEQRIKEVSGYLSGGLIIPAVLQSKCHDLESHILRVLRHDLFFHSDRKRLDKFWQLQEGIAAWKDSFTSAYLEMGSGNRCYLFAEPTASTFHYMRALEGGLEAFALALNITVETRDQWETIITNIEVEIKKINGPHAGADWKRKQELYAEVALHFRYLKNAWRNHVMHRRHTYDDKKAIEIADHVTALIGELSGELGLKDKLALFIAKEKATNDGVSKV